VDVVGGFRRNILLSSSGSGIEAKIDVEVFI
jgi:hypothetical protein